MLDVHGGDVVGQQHDFVAVEFGGVFGIEFGLGNLPHDPHDEVAGAHKGVEDVHASIAQGAAELGAQEMVNGAHHEIHNGLGGVNDAVGVGHLDGKALEEALIDGVQEALLLGVVID